MRPAPHRALTAVILTIIGATSCAPINERRLAPSVATQLDPLPRIRLYPKDHIRAVHDPTSNTIVVAEVRACESQTRKTTTTTTEVERTVAHGWLAGLPMAAGVVAWVYYSTLKPSKEPTDDGGSRDRAQLTALGVGAFYSALWFGSDTIRALDRTEESVAVTVEKHEFACEVIPVAMTPLIVVFEDETALANTTDARGRTTLPLPGKAREIKIGEKVVPVRAASVGK